MQWQPAGHLTSALRATVACMIAANLVMVASPVRADAPNSISAYVQPMSGCQVGRMGIMYCQGLLGMPISISSDPGANAPLWAGTGYALCWRTAAGDTLPAGSTCTEIGTASASGNDFAYAATARFPMTFDGSGGSGCSPAPNNNANSFFFNAGSPGGCVITISTPAALATARPPRHSPSPSAWLRHPP